MNELLIGLLAAALATNQVQAASNLVHEKTGLVLNVVDKNDPVEQAFQKLLSQDDAAQAEIDRWIKDNKAFAETGAGVEDAVLNAKIKQRIDEVKQAYDAFLLLHPDHARARVTYASFLSDTGDEDAALQQLEKAKTLDPKNPAIWNNLANYYGHNGPTIKAFECYEKALALNPKEAVYYQNFATTIYLFRHAATNYFKIGEQQAFDKAMGLYRKALELDPNNFLLASDYAQSYYGYRPRRSGAEQDDLPGDRKHWEQALVAWNQALPLAADDMERQGVYVHLARICINLGRFDEAKAHLDRITLDHYKTLRERLQKNIARKQSPAPQPEAASATNAPAPAARQP